LVKHEQQILKRKIIEAEEKAQREVYLCVHI
jgi:hypothetical protein